MARKCFALFWKSHNRIWTVCCFSTLFHDVLVIMLVHTLKETGNPKFCRQICEFVFICHHNDLLQTLISDYPIDGIKLMNSVFTRIQQHVKKVFVSFLLAYSWFMSIWVFWHVIGCLYLNSAGLMQQLHLHGSHGQVCPEHMLLLGNAWLYIIFASQVSDSLTLIRVRKSDTWLAKMDCTCAWTLLFGKILKKMWCLNPWIMNTL